MNRPTGLTELAAYLEGFGNAVKDPKLIEASHWLHKIAHSTCGAGMIGCYGGPNCSSDHK